LTSRDTLDQLEWLSAFRAKYDQSYDLHITLKQMANIEESDLPKIKERLENILERTTLSQKQLQLVFDQVQLDEHDVDSGFGWIYVFASKRNKILDGLQKQVREELAGYNDYRFNSSQEYEFNFQPHITIARELDSDEFAHALKELPSEVILSGRVTGIVLSCVKEAIIEEARNPSNLTIYRLDA
jgi:2'-5' RNA ligase